ncbi:cupin domain-containing protein [Clostridioides sp. ZZV14-6154]|uniref:cupin domain-containing protein n=1 Tax=Clostridioides sp. ZZV14-6154 TaxID=2811495 RepID=UPI001D0F94EB|nr:cupin domain-containing protein [Clostridioides sp. ZZV14-6154]
MIRKKSELQVEVKENLTGGVGKVTLENILQIDELKGKGRLFKRITLPVGSSIGVHDHTTDFEVYYILKGKGKVFDNGEFVEVNEGDVIYTADGEEHSIENIGEEELEFVAVVLYV